MAESPAFSVKLPLPNSWWMSKSTINLLLEQLELRILRKTTWHFLAYKIPRNLTDSQREPHLLLQLSGRYDLVFELVSSQFFACFGGCFWMVFSATELLSVITSCNHAIHLARYHFTTWRAIVLYLTSWKSNQFSPAGAPPCLVQHTGRNTCLVSALLGFTNK